MIYLYARVSTDKQENGREAQEQRLRSWVGDREHRLFVDEDVSAYSVKLHARPAGKAMHDMLKAGDVVAITKIDRAFRRMVDFAVTREQWEKLGVTLVVLDLPDNLTGPHGKFFLSMVVAAGELESDMHGQRKREVYAHKRALGLPYNQTRPFGWVTTRDKRNRLAGWAPCPREREAGMKVLELRAQGLSRMKIAITLLRAGYKKPQARVTSSAYYHAQDILLLERAARAGFPRLPRDFWQAGDFERKLLAMKSHGPLPGCEESGSSGSGRPQAPGPTAAGLR